jgi:hypothetical protein
MRPVSHRMILSLHLVINPVCDQLVAEHVTNSQECIVFRQCIESLLDGRWQRINPSELLWRPATDVIVNGTESVLGRVDLVADAINPGHELGCDHAPPVSGRVRRAKLEASGLSLVCVLWEAHGCAAVSQAEKGVRRRFISWLQAPAEACGRMVTARIARPRNSSPSMGWSPSWLRFP